MQWELLEHGFGVVGSKPWFEHQIHSMVSLSIWFIKVKAKAFKDTMLSESLKSLTCLVMPTQGSPHA